MKNLKGDGYMSKKLVAYFSASGVTAAAAEQLAKAELIYTKSSPKHPTPQRILTGQIKARAAL